MQLGRHFRNNTTNNARIMLNALAYLRMLIAMLA